MATLQATEWPANHDGYLNAATEQLFPLRLTPFEHYMLLDGTPGAWMVFTVIIEAQGTVNREALAEAVAFASARHPLCLATVMTDRWGRKFWSLAHNKQLEIYWTDGGELPTAWNRAPDLTHEPGVRVLVEQRGDQATITAKFHHACTDGVGSGQWIDDFLVRYATSTGNPDSPPRPNDLDPRRLLDRRRNRLPLRSRWTWLRYCVFELYKHFFQIPRPLRLPDSPSAVDPNFSGLVAHQFSAEETQQLRRAAHDKRVSLNACLLRGLFRAIAVWNAADAKSWFSNPWYRVNMPTSMREWADATTPATNLVGLTFLHRRRSSVAVDRDQLLIEIEKECEEIKRTRRGTLFLDSLAMMHAVPGLLLLLLSVPMCMCTAVLTNMGDPCRRLRTRFARRDGMIVVGDLIITAVGGACSTLRRHTHAAISVNTYCDRLTLNLNMTPGLFSRADVERFMEIYVGEIRSSLDFPK